MFNSYEATRKAILTGETTCVAIVQYYLDAIDRQQSLNVFLEVYAEEALERARLIDQQFAEGSAGKLAGMVIGVKDVICHQGHGLQAASKILDGFVSQFSATAIERVLSEGAIIIGRQNCDEFAMGSTNENSSFGATRNSIDPTKVPGGSSGASAVAVSAGMCLASLGSDTGGSVRQPAAFCGVVGLKPTYSRISRHGLVAYASSFDTIGILSHQVEDSALLLEVVAGKDEYDATVSQRAVGDYTKATKESGKHYRIGYIQETLEDEGLHEEIKVATQNKLKQLEDAGHEVVPINFDLLEFVLPTYYVLTAAEASTNLSRFDGVRYGHRVDNPEDLETLYKKSRSEGFGAEVQRRIMLGTFVLSASYYDAYFTKAQKVRRLIKEKTEALLQQVDFLVSPTTPTTAMPLGKFSESNVLEMYLADLFTVQASVAGIPAISIPNGKDSEGMPIGFQVMANSFEEEKLLHFSAMIQN